MCKELEKQMSEMLKGSEPTITTKAITILAMDIDKKFANVDNKLDNILILLKENKTDTDSKIKELRDSQMIFSNYMNLLRKMPNPSNDLSIENQNKETIQLVRDHCCAWNNAYLLRRFSMNMDIQKMMQDFAKKNK